MYVVKMRVISLLTTDVGTRKLIGVSREMEEVLKSHKIRPKILASGSNALMDILLENTVGRNHPSNKICPSANAVLGNKKNESDPP